MSFEPIVGECEQDVMETARLMLETARAMRTYTTTQVAPLLDQERAKAERSVQNMEQVLDVQMPAALQKAMPAACGQGTTDFANHASAACQQSAPATK